MTIQTFIEKAIEGGWLPGYIPFNLQSEYNSNSFEPVTGGEWNTKTLRPLRKQLTNADILLDPLAWQAVGKVEGWEQAYFRNGKAVDASLQVGSWLGHMHRMIDALAEGKTIEQFLETL